MKSVHKLQGLMCTKCDAFCLPNCSCSAFIAYFFPNHLHHTFARPCRRPSKSQKMGARAMGCGKSLQATRSHVHKMWGMCVSPKVLVVPSLHSLSPNHPHHTCARPCRRPSKSQKMGAREIDCEKCPQATRPHVHKM